MEHYVTLFDSLFLPQGLALQMSMERYAGEYTLWILCVDDQAYEVLIRLRLPNTRLLQLSKLETAELKRVKLDRTRGEYCWTVTPYSLRFVFEADISVQRVTYLDADMWFRKSPWPIFREFVASGKQVLITDHAYAPEYDRSAASGQYCVQFMIFTRDGGEIVRKWWEDRCTEWCYHRYEDNKFGDQKYLDDWPERFADHVHVLQKKEWLLAPWNAIRFPYSDSITWHFHGTQTVIKSNKLSGILCGNYQLPIPTRTFVYKVYLRDLRSGVKLIADLGVEIRSQSTFDRLKRLLVLIRPWKKITLPFFIHSSSTAEKLDTTAARRE